MIEEHDGASLTDKAREAAEKIKAAVEPGETGGPGGPHNDASDPFTNDQRPDETGFPDGSVAGTD
ncbi:hypothetical protein LQ327_00555 [Actinomycetospora endophytica]|uniref:Antitoxin protein of toxin-antitoxin system n=1 Tax=Actinomycetospora endophytica TaxID=2291215 RepID=A0ABS8P0V2_9PSEU|nr:hypothetical protein [Actinomycetospora endophytica]MCD2191879.1 hypothetical protein [Actinomycetospora endophytica]